MRFMRTIFVSLALLLLPALCMAVSPWGTWARMKSYVAVLENFLRDGTLPDGGTAEDSERILCRRGHDRRWCRLIIRYTARD